MNFFESDLFVYTHIGTNKAELMVGVSDSINVFVANEGGDIITSFGGTNTVAAGGGNDTVVLSAGYNNVVDGGSGNDVLFFQDNFGQSSAHGGSGNDRITMSGGEGWNSFLFAKGGSGNDTIFGGSGNDTLFGGTHQDALRGGWGDDFLSGDAGNDVLSGGLGNDHLYGGTGCDRLSGSGGQDWIDGGLGNDILFGGRLADTFVFSEFAYNERDVVADYKVGEDVILIGSDDYTVTQVGKNVLIEVDGNGCTASVLVLDTTVGGVQVDDLF
jgi:Ca2+-binding RTX toxin-like protein